MESWNEILDEQQFEILRQIYTEPPPSNLPWTDIQSLLEEIINRLGGRFNTVPGGQVRVKLDNVIRADFYQPYPPQNPTICPLIRRVRYLLEMAKVKP